MRKLILAALCTLGCAPVYAQDNSTPNLDAACAQNPQRCNEIRAKLQAKCADDPNACAEKKEKMKQRAADFKAKCEADPIACKEKKAKLRERMQQRLNQ